MSGQIFITVTQRGYTDSTLLGPFSSVEEGKKRITDNVERGLDGDETRYTFFKINNCLDNLEVGYVLLKDECDHDEGEDLKEEHFPE